MATYIATVLRTVTQTAEIEVDLPAGMSPDSEEAHAIIYAEAADTHFSGGCSSSDYEIESVRAHH